MVINNVPIGRRAISPQMRSSAMVQLRNKIAVELPGECLPNINDLRQIFDDASAGSCRFPNGMEAAVKRSSYTDRTTHSQQYKNCNYFDAKTSHVEENVFENKTRNLEFERVKQKFDNPLHLHLHQHTQHQQQQQRDRDRNASDRLMSGTGGNNRTNLLLSLKPATAATASSATTIVGSEDLNININPMKNDKNRQLQKGGECYSNATSLVHNQNIGIGKEITKTKGSVTGEGVSGNGNDRIDGIGDGGSENYMRNSINLDGLKISDDEVSL